MKTIQLKSLLKESWINGRSKDGERDVTRMVHSYYDQLRGFMDPSDINRKWRELESSSKFKELSKPYKRFAKNYWDSKVKKDWASFSG
jgi:hypothetical protein